MRQESAPVEGAPHGVAADARYRRIYESHYRAVLAYCLRRADSADAQDAAAEVFTIAWRRLADVPPDELPWLYGVAYRVISHQWRSERRRKGLVARIASLRPHADDSVDWLVVQREDYQLVQRAAARLKPLDREVLQLVMWEGLTHAQIAQMIGSTVPAAKQRFHRAKRRLAREFKNVGGTFQSPTAAQKGGGA